MKLKFGRIASYETEFADEPRCQQAKIAFLAKQWPDNTTTKEYPVVDNAGTLITSIISIKVTPAVGECYEMRFSVNPNPYSLGNPIEYYEIEKVSYHDDAGNGKALGDAVTELSRRNATVTRDATSDGYSINQKKAWRALLHSKCPITDDGDKVDDNKFTTTVKGDFGVVTNPPYPP